MSMKVTRDEFVGVDRMGEDELRDLAHELLSENAKLRKLVAKAFKCKIYDGFCSWCDKNVGFCPVERGMEELGIEVGEGEE